MPLTFEAARIGLVLTAVDSSGAESADPDAPCAFVEITDVAPGSPASQHPSLRLGPVIKGIQGQPSLGLSFNATVSALASAPRPLQIVVGKRPAPTPTLQPLSDLLATPDLLSL